MMQLLLPLLAKAANRWSVAVDALNMTHQLRPHDMGCHVDMGYSHQPRALYAQMVVGSSFDSAYPVDGADGSGWVDASSAPAAAGAATRDRTQRFGYQTDGQGLGSQRLRHTGSAGRIAVANRGLGNEGLAFRGGRPYEGHLYARNKRLSPARLVVSIESWTTGGRVLAKTVIAVPADSEWHRLNFTLVPNETTTCEGIAPQSTAANTSGISCPLNNTYRADAPMSDRPAHVCVRCGGQFVMALHQAGDVNLDAVFLQPGAWGRLGNNLSVNRDAVKWLQDMGTALLRVGGSYVSRPGSCPTPECTTPANYTLWTNWRGDPAQRLSSAATWGHDLVGCVLSP